MWAVVIDKYMSGVSPYCSHRWITVFLSDEVLGNVEVTINTSIVKWCIAILVLT